MSRVSRMRGLRPALALALGGCLVTAGARGQLAVRPDDPTGLSLRTPRLRVPHSDEPSPAGSSMHLQGADPWRAYALGHALFQREWGAGEGLFGALIARPDAGATNSCAMCHNLPFRSPGAGGNVADPGGYGRNTPHLFGLGLVETLAIQVRAELLARYDVNHNGFLDVPAETRGRRAQVEARPGLTLDFGPLEDLDGDGLPGLNDVLRVTLVDGEGHALEPEPGAASPRLGDARVAGYDPHMAPLSSSAGDHQFATLRSFSVGALSVIFGLSIDDPTLTHDDGLRRDRVARDGWAETSNAGAPQPRPAQRTLGRARADVDEGEVDLLEWFLANHPAPAQLALDARARRGRELMEAFGCTACHVSDWQIKAADARLGLPGDRRFFDLEVGEARPGAGLRGRLRRLTQEQRLADGTLVQAPRRQAFLVRGIYSDLRHHDVGQRFYEYTSRDKRLFVTRRFRTAPLWGVGSSAPYGHDGRSLSLDDVIRRHGGEAESAAAAYSSAPASERDALLAFLRALVLYAPDQLPTDLDGDGRVAAWFERDGRRLGPERFNPELLFAVAPRYRGFTRNADGETYFSYALENAAETWSRDLRPHAEPVLAPRRARSAHDPTPQRAPTPSLKATGQEAKP